MNILRCVNNSTNEYQKILQFPTQGPTGPHPPLQKCAKLFPPFFCTPLRGGEPSPKVCKNSRCTKVPEGPWLVKLYPTPPSILTLVTWVPQSKLALGHSPRRLPTVGLCLLCGDGRRPAYSAVPKSGRMVSVTCRTRWKMIPFLVTNVINCVILANTIPCMVKNIYIYFFNSKYNADDVISFVS